MVIFRDDIEHNTFAQRIKGMLQKPFFASFCLFLVLFCLLSSTLIFSGGDPQPDDHYFHFKYAHLLRIEGWDRVVENFDWIYLLNDNDGVHRYSVSLFQIFLIPFTFIKDQFLAIHIADSLFLSGVVAIVYYVMRREKVRYALFFTLLLVGSTFFMKRFLLGRAFVLMVGLVYLEMFFAIRKKYFPLFVTTVLHVLWHEATYFFPLIVTCFVEFSRYTVQKKIQLQVFLSTIFGIILGMAFYPGFPGSLISFMRQIFAVREGTVGSDIGTLGGGEMSTTSMSSASVGHIAAGLILFFCFGVVSYIYYLYKRDDQPTKDMVSRERMQWLVCLSAFILFIVIASATITGRFFDFAFPAFVILAGLTFTVLMDAKIINTSVFKDKYFKVIAWVPLVLLLVYSFVFVYERAASFDFTPGRLAAEWINEHSDDGDKVFLHNWSYFVTLFFANSDNVYSMGLEPTSLKTYDESLYWKYYNIFRNKYYCEDHGDCKKKLYDELMVQRSDPNARNAFKKRNSENVINAIKNDFGARYVFSESNEFSGMLLLSRELIEDYEFFDFEKSDGTKMQFSVFKLK